MGEVLHLNQPRTAEEAWERYVELVNERAERNLWADLDHNKRLVRAWDEWSRLFLAGEKRS
jgi:ribosomal protein S17E